MRSTSEMQIDDFKEDSDDNDEEGWNDVDSDDDEIAVVFVSLFDPSIVFTDIYELFEDHKANHQFDVYSLIKHYNLEFLGLVKLINFVRREASHGNHRPDVSRLEVFDKDEFLLPVLENDAVIFNLEEILQKSKSTAEKTIDELKDEMTALQARFDAYREEVKTYLDKHLQNTDAVGSIEEHDTGKGKSRAPPDSQSAAIQASHNRSRTEQLLADDDTDYFHSYSTIHIHESMLKDKIRTEAYRDFIYDNKHIFKDKVVLDVGCGTGILSMFCARAGAKQVIAVDNSDMIDTAREIIRANELDDIIRCVQGKIEDVDLPVQQVDIIISEWMGYALLYESMLDSVLSARDKYLKPDGLMVPSHANMLIASISESSLREESFDYWGDIYGFDMRAMQRHVTEELLVKVVKPEEISSSANVFYPMDLHTITTEKLSFEKPFSIYARKPSGGGGDDGGTMNLEGFVLWFDIFFSDQRKDVELQQGRQWVKTKSTVGARQLSSFSTSASSQATHWSQSIALLQAPLPELGLDDEIVGTVNFRKAKDYSRGLQVEICWSLYDRKNDKARAGSAREQTWHLS